MMQQYSAGGYKCCDGGDAIYPEDWGVDANGYWVVLDGARIEVPANRLVTKPNPTHRAVAWIYPPNNQPGHLQCFAPGTLS